MGETTAIAWTDHTFNPWWGCTKVSAACDNCYAETFARRTGHDVWGKDGERRLFGDKHWNEPIRWDRRAAEAAQVHPDLAERKVFCASMADVFEPHPAVERERIRLWDLIDATPNLIWQLLTKRPEQIPRMMPPRWRADGWPRNVWLGTTVEHQYTASLRIPRLLAVPGDPAVRFLSCEPLLGYVSLTRWLGREDGIGWVICGGESGPGHRPLDLGHARALRDQVMSAGLPFFFKQASGYRSGTPGPPDLDDIKEFPIAHA